MPFGRAPKASNTVSQQIRPAKRVHSNMPSRDGVKVIQNTKSCNLMTSSNCRQSATDRATHNFSQSRQSQHAVTNPSQTDTVVGEHLASHMDPEHPLNLIRAYESSSIFRGGDTRSLATCNDAAHKIPQTQGLQLQNRRSLFAYANRKSLIKTRNSSMGPGVIPNTGASKGKMSYTVKVAQPSTLLSHGALADPNLRPSAPADNKIFAPPSRPNQIPLTSSSQAKRPLPATPGQISFQPLIVNSKTSTSQKVMVINPSKVLLNKGMKSYF